MQKTTFSDKIDQFLDNGIAIYTWLIIAILFTTPVNAELGRLISRLVWAQEGGKFVHGLMFAIIIEIGIFILASIGERGAAKFVMFYSIFAHLLYFHYWDELIELNYGDYISGTLDYNMKLSGGIVKLLASIGVSIVAPTLIFFFSDKIAERRTLKMLSINLSDLERTNADTERELAEGQRNLATMKRDLATINKLKEGTETEYVSLNNNLTDLKREIVSLRNTKNAMSRRTNTEVNELAIQRPDQINTDQLDERQ